MTTVIDPGKITLDKAGPYIAGVDTLHVSIPSATAVSTTTATANGTLSLVLQTASDGTTQTFAVQVPISHTTTAPAAVTIKSATLGTAAATVAADGKSATVAVT